MSVKFSSFSSASRPFCSAALMLLGVLLSGTTQAQVPNPGTTQDTGGLSSLRGVIGTQAGTYEFLNYNKSQIQAQFLDQIKNRSEVDYQFALKGLADIDALFADLIEAAIYATSDDTSACGLKTLSNRSTSSDSAVLSQLEYLEALDRFNRRKMTLDLQIGTIQRWSQIFPSQTQVALDGSGVGSLPKYGDLNFAPLVDFYSRKLAEIQTALSNLPFQYKDRGGVLRLIAPNSGKALTFEPKGLPVSLERIEDLKRELATARGWSSNQRQTIDQMTVHLRQLIQSFVRTYGEDERYRPQSSQDLSEAEKAYKEIVVGFWARSYFRAAYGIPLGTIGIRFKKQVAKLEYFLTSTRSLVQWMEEPVWDQQDLIAIEEAFNESVKVADERTQKVLDGDASFLVKVNSLMTYLGGYRRLAEVASMILRLIAADLYEEKVLMVEGNLSKLKAFYQARYFSNPEDEAFYRELRRVYDPADDERSSVEETTSSLTGAGSNVRAHFNQVKSLAEVKLIQLAQIRDQEVELEAALAAVSEHLKRVNKRKKDF